MKRVRYEPAAALDIQEAVDFYDARRTSLGTAFLAVIRAAVRRLRESPFLGSSVEGAVRRFVLGRFPYTIIYEVKPEEILVLAVVDHSQASDRWQNRR